MMVERHYDDEALISLLASDRLHADAHLPSCSSCTAKLQSVRAIAATLREASVWDTRRLPSQPSRTTIGNLRAFADRMTYEDSRAEAYLRDLLEGPRETWMARLQAHPEWRTAGIVRKLIAAASRAVDTMPRDAVEMTAMATEIADNVAFGAYASDVVARLRGASWRERSFALYYTGQFPDALKAADRSHAEFALCAVDEYDRARTDIVRSVVLRAFERFDEAQAVARETSATFTRYEDLARSASSGIAEAHLLYSRGEYAKAKPILEALERRLRDSDEVETHARVLGNLAYCVRRMGDVTQALRYYDLATDLFEVLGIRTEVTKNRWNIAAILAESGRLADAQQLFEEVAGALEAAGMTSEATLARLDIAELFLVQGRFAEVERICRAAMQSFERAGMAYTTRAMTALGFIHEAASQRTATPTLVRGVRDYLKRLPAEPTLLFAIAPE
jgi:tetratricopeptide (TPR) repeat protein